MDGFQPKTLFGYLEKQSPAGLQLWQKRFFICKDGSLSYYSSHKTSHEAPKGVIQLIYIREIRVEGKVFHISLVGGTVFHLKGSSREETSKWVLVLEHESQNAKNAALGNSSDNPQAEGKYWKVAKPRSTSVSQEDKPPVLCLKKSRSATQYSTAKLESNKVRIDVDAAFRSCKDATKLNKLADAQACCPACNGASHIKNTSRATSDRVCCTTYSRLKAVLDALDLALLSLNSHIEFLSSQAQADPGLKFVYGEEFNTRVFDHLAACVADNITFWRPFHLFMLGRWMRAYEKRLKDLGLTSLETRLPLLPASFTGTESAQGDLRLMPAAIMTESLVANFLTQPDKEKDKESSAPRISMWIGSARRATKSDTDCVRPLAKPTLPVSPTLKTLLVHKNVILWNTSPEEVVEWLSTTLTVLRLYTSFPVKEMADCEFISVVSGHLRDMPRDWLTEELVAVLSSLVLELPALSETFFNSALKRLMLDFDLWACAPFSVQMGVVDFMQQVADLYAPVMDRAASAPALMELRERCFRFIQPEEAARHYHSVTHELLGSQELLEVHEVAELRQALLAVVSLVAKTNLTADHAQNLLTLVDGTSDDSKLLELLSFLGSFLQSNASSPGAQVLASHFLSQKSQSVLFKLLRRPTEMVRVVGIKLIIELIRAVDFKDEHERAGLYSAVGVALQSFALCTGNDQFSLTYSALMECLYRKSQVNAPRNKAHLCQPLLCSVSFSAVQEEVRANWKDKIEDVNVVYIFLALLPSLDAVWAETLLGDINTFLMKLEGNVEVWSTLFGWQSLLLNIFNLPRSWAQIESKCGKLIANIFKLVAVHYCANVTDSCAMLHTCFSHLQHYAEQCGPTCALDVYAFMRRLVHECLHHLSQQPAPTPDSKTCLSQGSPLSVNLPHLLMFLEEILLIVPPAVDGRESQFVEANNLRRDEHGQWVDLKLALLAIKVVQTHDLTAKTEFKQQHKDAFAHILRKGGYLRVYRRLVLISLREASDEKSRAMLCAAVTSICDMGTCRLSSRQTSLLYTAWFVSRLPETADTSQLLQKLLAACVCVVEALKTAAPTLASSLLPHASLKWFQDLLHGDTFRSVVLPLLLARGTAFLDRQAVKDGKHMDLLAVRRAVANTALAGKLDLQRQAIRAAVHTAQTAVTVVVGRHVELDTFQSVLNKLVTRKEDLDSALLVLVVGAAGMGKSVLVLELRFIANLLALPVLVALADRDDADSGVPYRPWSSIVYRILDVDVDTQNIGQVVSNALSVYVPHHVGMEALLNPLLPVDLSDTTATRNFDADCRAAALSMLLFELLEAYLAESPKVLVFENVQWMDEPSTALLKRLLASIPPTIIVATSRDPDSFADIENKCACIRMNLEALDETHTRTLVANKLGTAVSDDLAAVIYARSKGHPYLSESVAMAMRDLDLLELHAPSNTYTLSSRRSVDDWDACLPSTLDELIGCRLDCLTAAHADVIGTAALVGERFGLAQLHHLLATKFSLQELEDILQVAVAADLLTTSLASSAAAGEAVAGQTSFAFKNAVVQANAYARIDDARRASLHLQAAEWIEEHADEASSFADLARHFLQAKQNARALNYLEQAGEAAYKSNSHKETVRFFKQALEVVGGSEDAVTALQKGRWLRCIGDAHHALGNLEEARMYLDEALQCIRGKGLDSAKKCVFVERRQSSSSKSASARRLCRTFKASTAVAERTACMPGSSSPVLDTDKAERLHELCSVLDTLFQVLYLSGNKESPAAALTALSYADQLGPSTHLARALATSSVAARVSGECALADRYIEEALAVANDLDSARELTLCYVHLMTSISQLSANQTSGLSDNLAHCVGTYTQLGHTRKTGEAMFVRHLVLYFGSQLEASLELAWELAELGNFISDAQLSAWGLTSQARVTVLTSSGSELDRVLFTLVQAGEKLNQQKNIDVAEHINVHALRALVLFRQGRLVQAVLHAEEVVALAPKRPSNLRLAVGYAAIAEMVALAMESDPNHTQVLALSKSIRRLCVDVRKAFDIARPRCALWEGYFLAIEGKTKAAEKMLEEAMQLAFAASMTLEVGLATYALAHFRFKPTQPSLWDDARHAFLAIGAEYYVAMMDKERPPPRQPATPAEAPPSPPSRLFAPSIRC